MQNITIDILSKQLSAIYIQLKKKPSDWSQEEKLEFGSHEELRKEKLLLLSKEELLLRKEEDTRKKELLLLSKEVNASELEILKAKGISLTP